jgi:hypothetical protein
MTEVAGLVPATFRLGHGVATLGREALAEKRYAWFERVGPGRRSAPRSLFLQK